MKKLFLPAFLSLALLLFVSSSHHFATAASLEQKMDEVESILLKMEDQVKAFRYEMEDVYRSRCDSQTINKCLRNNYNDCISTFPNQQCAFVMPQCGDSPTTCAGKRSWDNVSTKSIPEVSTPDCNVLVDTLVSKVSIPNSVTTSKSEVIAKVVESACYSRLAEEFMVSKYKESKIFWAKYNTQPSSSYFGGHDGHFRQVPALHQAQCGCYDPRYRPWYVAASSGPKNVVIVIDVSGSMGIVDGMRMGITREAAVTIVDTLTVADSFTVIAFSSEAYQLGGTSYLLEANSTNKERLKAEINQLEPDGATNFFAAFTTAFDAIDNTLVNEASTKQRIAILFMTDGRIGENMNADDREIETTKVIDLVNERSKQLSEKGKKVTIFTYSLGEESDQNVTKTIACRTDGVWTPVDDYGDLVGEMSSYYKLFALGRGEGVNEDAVSWVEPYKFIFRGVMGTTVSLPVYDRSVTPSIFLGVVAVDIYISAIEQILGEGAMTWLSDWIRRRNFIVRPKVTAELDTALTDCQLDALRFLSSGPDATCGSNSSSYASCVPEKCKLFENASIDDLWQNTELEGKTYKGFQSEMCPAPSPDPVTDTPVCCDRTISSGTSAIISAIVVISFGVVVPISFVVVLAIYHHCKKASNVQGNQVSDPEKNLEEPENGITVASKVDIRSAEAHIPHVIPVPVQWSPPSPSAPPLHPNE